VATTDITPYTRDQYPSIEGNERSYFDNEFRKLQGCLRNILSFLNAEDREFEGEITVDSLVTSLMTNNGHCVLAEIATPATPPVGFMSLYAKNDKKLYALDSDGVETALF
jgi:hypothetical protein